MKKLLFILSSVLLLAACEEWEPVFTLKYDEPAAFETQTLQANCTIAQLVSKYELGNPKEITENLIIAGKVSTTDRPGNFYKSFYIQDETGGIEIKIGKNALYNDYLPGQTIYVKCQGMTIGMYGYKQGKNYGMGMVQLGFSDPTGQYETSYIESPLFIDAHIIKGAYGPEVEPVAISEKDMPSSNDIQSNNKYIGQLVTINDLDYGWYDSGYKEQNEAFVLLYLDSTSDKKASKNRIFVSGTGTGITTWAMSKTKMTEYLYSGIWDSVNIGNANDYNHGTVGDRKGDGTYPTIEKAAGSVSHYFSTPSGKCVQIRTSGFSKFGDAEIDPELLSGNKQLSVTGILCMYQGKVQMVVNSLDDFKIQ